VQALLLLLRELLLLCLRCYSTSDSLSLALPRSTDRCLP
jgi:hypothetical protein